MEWEGVGRHTETRKACRNGSRMYMSRSSRADGRVPPAPSNPPQPPPTLPSPLQPSPAPSNPPQPPPTLPRPPLPAASGARPGSIPGGLVLEMLGVLLVTRGGGL
ncbi:unnamed protein product [Arctogadus glacialis]